MYVEKVCDVSSVLVCRCRHDIILDLLVLPLSIQRVSHTLRVRESSSRSLFALLLLYLIDVICGVLCVGCDASPCRN